MCKKKCLGKIGNVAKKGELFYLLVYMSTVESLCDRGILLELGSLCLDGTAEEAVRGLKRLTVLPEVP